jgi:hypothetical protein
MVPVACNLNGEIDVYQNFIMSPLLVGLGVMIAAYGIPPSALSVVYLILFLLAFKFPQNLDDLLLANMGYQFRPPKLFDLSLVSSRATPKLRQVILHHATPCISANHLMLSH